MLTKAIIEQAKSRETPYVVWDTEIPGFGLRVYPSGRRAFILQCRPMGSRKSVLQTLVLLSRKITKPTGSFRLERRECDSL